MLHIILEHALFHLLINPINFPSSKTHKYKSNMVIWFIFVLFREYDLLIWCVYQTHFRQKMKRKLALP